MGLGTNAGLKQVAGATTDANYEESFCMYIAASFTRVLCGKHALGSPMPRLAIRNAAVWRDAGTACASDSTKFGDWGPQPVMTELKAFSAIAQI